MYINKIGFIDGLPLNDYQKQLIKNIMNDKMIWIPVDDRKRKMPAETDVLVLFDTGEIRRYMEEDLPKALITHWMPLPDGIDKS